MNVCPLCRTETENEYCEICEEARNLKKDLVQKLRTNIQDQKTEKTILQDLDKLIDLSKESQWKQDKGLIVNAILSERLHPVTAWRLFVILQNIKGQSQHEQEWEKETIELLRNKLKFSLNSIAFILGRSKETVMRYSEKEVF